MNSKIKEKNSMYNWIRIRGLPLAESIFQCHMKTIRFDVDLRKIEELKKSNKNIYLH